jgi:hypothetical protein
MSLATDLIGLGEQPLVAQRTSNGGIGPLTAVAIGTNYATGYQMKGAQYFVEITSGSGAFVSLPIVGSDNGALLGDNFVIINNAGGTVTLAAPTNVNMFGSIGTSGAATAPTNTLSLANNTVYAFWPVTTTLWAGKSN